MKFGDPKILKNELKKISVKTEEGKPLRIMTSKCAGFGVKKSEEYRTKSLSIVLDEGSRKELEKIIKGCKTI